MITVINELGKQVPCAGSIGSPLWVSIRFTRQLHQQVQSYLQQQICNIKEPVIVFEGELENNIDFVRAVKFYAQHPEWL